jgi:hypothetical protein
MDDERPEWITVAGMFFTGRAGHSRRGKPQNSDRLLSVQVCPVQVCRADSSRQLVQGSGKFNAIS